MTRRAPGLIFVAACVAALALRLLVPPGWMPTAGNDGVVISLCSGTTVPVDPASPARHGDQPCGFAVAMGPWLAAAALLLPILLLPLLPLPRPVAVVPVARRHRPRPPGQGPPHA